MYMVFVDYVPCIHHIDAFKRHYSLTDLYG